MNYLSKATEYHFDGNWQFIVKSEFWNFFQLLLNFWHQTNGVSITVCTAFRHLLVADSNFGDQFSTLVTRSSF